MMPRKAALVSLALLAACGGGYSGVPLGPTPDVTGCPVTAVANEGWQHVPEGSAVAYRHDPPASGPHYPVWARYEEYASPLARGYWVHNLEHGAVVFLYRPDTPAATVEALRQAFRSLPADPACGHARALFTPDPLLQQQTAVVAADVVLASNCLDPQVIRSFVAAYRGRGPENVCAHGTRP